MLRMPKLREQQINQFKGDGFLLIENGFNQSNISMIESWTTELAEMPEKSGGHWVFHEKSKLNPDTKLISRIEKISPFHLGFAKLSNVLK